MTIILLSLLLILLVLINGAPFYLHFKIKNKNKNLEIQKQYCSEMKELAREDKKVLHILTKSEKIYENYLNKYIKNSFRYCFLPIIIPMLLVLLMILELNTHLKILFLITLIFSAIFMYGMFDFVNWCDDKASIFPHEKLTNDEMKYIRSVYKDSIYRIESNGHITKCIILSQPSKKEK